ncbi:family 1 encapsulin nanocompartment shell protein [Aneurinibacillus thermoaerophilus]|uniref:family 1 encapsulin nanocompartment shell protein n=1 Tax=Aneurinibacillus thermoaerophilus TaxID=143495 RepID=UPI002E1BCC03|nr:family 1 encapsulin nanocompartment shell protein [Aneurinibacillus thermoaerophilus]MED0676301.1 family 1 encapsulin nanocompartment shell protein [Aneurinibacillus thermoaerophilus]
MDKLRKFPDSPLTEQNWNIMEEIVIEAARRQLIGRRFIDIYGPLGEGIQTVNNDIFEEPQDGGISLRGESLELSQPTRRVNLSIPMLYKDFILYWRDLEQAKTLGIPIDMSPAANAAVQCAHLEDNLIFNGSPQFELSGLMNVPGRLTHIRGEWMKSGQAFEDVVEAISKLQQMGYTGPYAMVLSPELYSLLHRVHPGTNVLEIEHVRELVTDGVFQSPEIKGKAGVIVNTGQHNLDLAIAEDFHTAYLDTENMNHLFRVHEAIVLRIKRPSAICTLEDSDS